MPPFKASAPNFELSTLYGGRGTAERFYEILKGI